MYNFKTLDDMNLGGKIVLVRVDFNVPMDSEGEIKDDTRIKAHLKTIKYIGAAGAKVILMSHLGKADQSLQPVAERLTYLLNKPITFINDCVGDKVKETIKGLSSSSILLLENTRAHAGEKENDDAFAQQLASLCDVYVNDAFAAAHRAHASTYGITKFVKEKAAGLLMQSEIETLNKILVNPQKPLIVLIGGAKVSSKLGVLKQLATKADHILIGGAMANTFLKATNVDVGSSMVEDSMLAEALNVLKIANQHNCKIILPSDVTVAEKLEKNITTENPNVNDIKPHQIAFDIGKHTTKFWAELIESAGTILWNGPVGVFEVEPFHLGTKTVAEAVGKTNAFTVIGGGDTIHAASKFNIMEKVDYVSTGGGSLLEFIEGKPLPALETLNT
jgi:phosphoglycerate kinase